MSKGFKRTIITLGALVSLYGGLRYLSGMYIDNSVGYFEVKVDLPKEKRIKEDFFEYVPKQPYGRLPELIDDRIVRECIFYDRRLLDIYKGSGVMDLTFEFCGPCKGLDRYVFDEFAEAFSGKLKIGKFFNTFDNQANCMRAVLADGGTPAVLIFDDGKISYRKHGFSKQTVDETRFELYSEAGELVQKIESSKLRKAMRFLSGKY